MRYVAGNGRAARSWSGLAKSGQTTSALFRPRGSKKQSACKYHDQFASGIAVGCRGLQGSAPQDGHLRLGVAITPPAVAFAAALSRACDIYTELDGFTPPTPRQCQGRKS